jgi:gluconate 2-dehydrogenase gamma chain
VSETPPDAGRTRRDFIAVLGSGVSAAWLSSLWPAALADAATATELAAQGQQSTYRTLTPQQAADFGAAADRIIPPDDTPGARAAGVVFFADRVLASLVRDRKAAFDNALTELNAATRKVAPNARSFAALTAAQQDAALRSIETTDAFAILRGLTVAGYFSHPSYGGNRNSVGWKAIGFEDRMAWTRPFGYYDRPEVMARLLPRRPA